MTSLKALHRARRRRKEKLTCAEVQKALAAETGGDGCYDALTALRFLPCNSQCKQAEVRRPFSANPTSLLTFPIPQHCLQWWGPLCSLSESLRSCAGRKACYHAGQQLGQRPRACANACSAGVKSGAATATRQEAVEQAGAASRKGCCGGCLSELGRARPQAWRCHF